jgi:hypothetical protein
VSSCLVVAVNVDHREMSRGRFRMSGFDMGLSGSGGDRRSVKEKG